DFGCVASVCFLHGGQLVNTTKDRVTLGGDHVLADAEAVQLGPLKDQVPDNVFVQAVGGADGAVLIPGGIQHGAGLLGQVGNVAAVDPDALGPLAHGGQHLVKDLDGVGYAAFQHAVGIYQQNAVVRVEPGVLLKGVILGGEHLDPAVG